jgi:hypothetical protein
MAEETVVEHCRERADQDQVFVANFSWTPLSSSTRIAFGKTDARDVAVARGRAPATAKVVIRARIDSNRLDLNCSAWPLPSWPLRNNTSISTQPWLVVVQRVRYQITSRRSW